MLSIHIRKLCVHFTYFFVDWKELWQSGILSLYYLFPEGKGIRVKYSVVVEEDLTYTVSFQGTAVDLQKCVLTSTLPSLASQPYFSSCACALGRGAGEGKEKYVW